MRARVEAGCFLTEIRRERGTSGIGSRALSRSSSRELDRDVDAGESRSASAVELSVKVYVLYSARG